MWNKAKRSRDVVYEPGLSLERLERTLRGMDYQVKNEDTRLMGRWNGILLGFRVLDEDWLIISVLIERTETEVDPEFLRQSMNAWNRDNVFPSLYPIFDNEEFLGQGDCVFPVSEGISENQLDTIIHESIKSAIAVVSYLQKTTPAIDI